MSDKIGLKEELAESYSNRLLHYLRTEQMITFEQHQEKADLKYFAFEYFKSNDINHSTLTYIYINHKEEIIIKTKNV